MVLPPLRLNGITLVVLDANLLEDIHNSTKIHAVILNGKVLDRSTIDKQLEAIEERARRR